MSMKPQPIEAVPEQTQQAAKAAFPKGNPYMKMRDELGVLYEDNQFDELFSRRGQPALSPWRLALVTVMQFAENLTDRQAADAVRARIDWKYALGLELSDPGFDFSVLSEFRTRLLEANAEHVLLETMLSQFQAKELLRAQGKQRTDSTHIVAAIRSYNRLELVAETMVHMLNVLAKTAPVWLKAWVPEEWYSRYAKRLDEYRLPQERKERMAFSQILGTDGYQLLSMIYFQPAPDEVCALADVEIMRQIWLQQYYVEDEKVQWRYGDLGMPRSPMMMASPYETEARHCSKRNATSWVGYKAHLTETCDPDGPHLITNVQTTVSTDSDNFVTAKIHQELGQQKLLPKEHLLDLGYGSTDLLLDSRKNYDIELICPMRPDNSWQAHTEGAFDLTQFEVDWKRCQVKCPEGKISRYWKQGKRHGFDKILVVFDPKDCQVCPPRSRCTRNRGIGARELTFAPQQEFETLQQARQLQKTNAFRRRYAKREGIEGTISQAINAFGMRRCRYRGMKKAHLQHVLTACAMNLTRTVNWLSGKPREKTRVSPFVALAHASVASG